MSRATKAYVGDGVYAEMTSWGDVVLTTENGVSITNTIVLEPSVWRGLERWKGEVDEMRRKALEDAS